MARVTYGALVTELAGSIGGVTFQRNASGPIAKLRSNPTVNPTALQAEFQNNMATVIAFWPTLSAADKTLWDDFAALHDHTTSWGEIKTLSGYQWFLSVNLTRTKFNLSIVSSPPGWQALSPPDSFTLVATAAYLRCEWAPAYDPTQALNIFLTLPLRQSSMKLRRSLYYVTYRAPGDPLDNFVLTSYFESLANITWASFYASANCSIICRMFHGNASIALFSAFTSALVKIG